MQVPARPKTTFNVGVIGGGTSVNSIPFESWMEVDMRSESPQELAKAAETFLGLMHEAVDEENKARSTAQGKIELDVKLIGDRPSITIDSGGRGGRGHALDEWIDIEKTSSLKGMYIAMGILLSLAGVQ
jgi:tripeptide aminopeptidase